MRILSTLFIAVCGFALCLAPAFAQSNDREAFRDAENRFTARNYALAVDRYDDLFRRWPDSPWIPDARFHRAVALYRLGRAEEAWASFNLIEARYRSTRYLSAVPFWKGVILYEKGDHAAALAAFETALGQVRDEETIKQVLLYAGKTYTALGKDIEAIGAFERLQSRLSRPEEEASHLLFLASLYAKEGDHARLVTLYERLDQSLLPEDIREGVALRTAGAYLASGKAAQAQALFESLARSSRNDIALAALQQLMAQSADAGTVSTSAWVVRAESALRGNPQQLADFWRQVGISAFHEGRLDLARSYFQRIYSLLGNKGIHPEVPIYLAEIAAREGKLDEAAQLLRTALGEAGDYDARMRERLAWYDIRREDWKEIISILDGRPDKGPAANGYLAYALYRQGRNADALDTLARAEAASNHGARLEAELLQLLGRDAEALESLDEILSRASGDAGVQLARMALLFKRAQYARILSDLGQREAHLNKLQGQEPIIQAAWQYIVGISFVSAGNYASAFERLDAAIRAGGSGTSALGQAAPWAAYYRAWSLYRLSRLQEAKAGFDALAATNARHELAYSALYLSAWCSAGLKDYKVAAASAKAAADLAAAGGRDSAERLARAAFLEGTLRPYFQDWDGALAALDRARNAGVPAYTLRASFERAVVLDMAGRVDKADAAYEEVSRRWPQEELGSTAAFRRGELMFRAERWAAAAERFAAYRQAWPRGSWVDGSLYLGGLSLSNVRQVDAGILLWERLLADHPESVYRFPAFLATSRAYRQKEDWAAAFRAATSAMAEFPERAKAAGVDDEAETLRYLMTGLPERAARLHTALAKQNGAATPAGRQTAIQLARFYIQDSGQREAGLPLLEDVLAMRAEDPAAAAEAALLKGDYLVLVTSWDRAAEAFLLAVESAAKCDAAAKTAAGASIRNELSPEALYKAADARLRAGKKQSATETAQLLIKTYPGSPWASRAKRLMETQQ